jgi:K+-transporting ATPase A subunit
VARGRDRAEEMNWLQYLLAILLFNAVGGLALFALLMLRACCRLTRSICRACHGIWR